MHDPATDPAPARYFVCDGVRVIELEAVPAGGYRFDPPPDPDSELPPLDGRCDRPEDAFWHFRDEPAPPPSPPLSELAAIHAAAAADPNLTPDTVTLVARRGGETLVLYADPADGPGYAVRAPADPRLHTTAYSLSDCFEMIEDCRRSWDDDAADAAAVPSANEPVPMAVAA